MSMLIDLLKQIPYLFLHPMLYFGILIIILQYRRQVAFERKLFSSRLHSLPKSILSSLAFGLLGGIIASSLMVIIGVVFTSTDMILVWLITGVLILFNIRFLCLSYSAGLLGVIAGVVQLYEQQLRDVLNHYNLPWILQGLDVLLEVHIPSLIAITAILHLVEAVLIKLQTSKQATPLFIETKRGKLVGAYHLQSFWLLPIFLVVVTNDAAQGGEFLGSWWPLIGGGTTLGFMFLPIPAMIGYTALTSVYTPKEKSNSAFIYLLSYSILLLALAISAQYFSIMQIIAAAFAGLGHEAIHLISSKREKKLLPKFTHPIDGLKVLAIIPGSLAERMGILAGEIIKKVNGVPVSNVQELYQALQKQSAFTKLEVINLAGHLKFAQHSIYTNDHHQLGIILSPDEKAPFYIEIKDTNLIKLLGQKVKKITRGA